LDGLYYIIFMISSYPRMLTGHDNYHQ